MTLRQNYERKDLIAFFETFKIGFDRGIKAVGSIDLFYNIGRATICFKFAGLAFIPQIKPDLVHLKTETVAKSNLTVF